MRTAQTSLSLSLVVPVVMGEVARLQSYFLHIFFPLLTFLSLCSLPTVSNSFLYFAVVLHSPPTLPISLNPVLPSHSQSSSPPFPLHFLLSLPIFQSQNLTTCPARFSLVLTRFLKLSFTPTSTLSPFILLLFALFTPTILFIQPDPWSNPKTKPLTL